MKSTIAGQADSCDNGAALMQFAVGFKLQGTTGHVVGVCTKLLTGQAQPGESFQAHATYGSHP
jgi:hypothetical protein